MERRYLIVNIRSNGCTVSHYYNPYFHLFLYAYAWAAKFKRATFSLRLHGRMRRGCHLGMISEEITTVIQMK